MTPTPVPIPTPPPLPPIFDFEVAWEGVVLPMWVWFLPLLLPVFAWPLFQDIYRRVAVMFGWLYVFKDAAGNEIIVSHDERAEIEKKSYLGSYGRDLKLRNDEMFDVEDWLRKNKRD